MTDELREICLEATETWGEEAQIDMVGEEATELATAIFQYWRGRVDKEELAKEAADVEIMLEQLRVIIGDSIVDREKARKIRRLRNRLDVASPNRGEQQNVGIERLEDND